MSREDDFRGNQSYKFSVSPDYFRYNAIPDGSWLRFSPIEVREIVISVLVLTLAFAFMLNGGIFYGIPDLEVFVYLIIWSFLAVVTAFLFHELAHKKVAQSYGLFAEYRMSPQGLFIGLVSSMIGFLFALPGAVVISGRLSASENAKISLAGPITNIIIGTVCLAFIFLLDTESIIRLVLTIIVFVNSWLAVFNLLPIPPLDGSKIFSWNPFIYIMAMGIAVAMFASAFILL